jgi:hypothetical protein
MIKNFLGVALLYEYVMISMKPIAWSKEWRDRQEKSIIRDGYGVQF